MKQFKHLKTFESFSGEEVNEEFIGKLIDKVRSAVSTIKSKFATWKDAKKKEVAMKAADLIEKNPKKVEELKSLFDAIPAEDKAKIQAKVKSFTEAEADKVVASAGVSEAEGNTKRLVKVICGWLGISTSSIGLITAIVGMVLSVMTGGGATAVMVCVVGCAAVLGSIVPLSVAGTGVDKKGNFKIAN